MFSSPLTPFLHQVGMKSSFRVHWVIFPQTWSEKMVNQFHAVSFKREMSAVRLKRVHCDVFATHKELYLDSRHHRDKFFILLKRNGYTNTEKKKHFKTNLANKLRFALESMRAKAKRKICSPLTYYVDLPPTSAKKKLKSY